MSEQENRDKIEKLKKPIIYILMGLVFIGCMFLIFQPSNKDEGEKDRIEGVPQANAAELQSDKLKIYEEELFKRKDNETVQTLAGYLGVSEETQAGDDLSEIQAGSSSNNAGYRNYGGNNGSYNSLGEVQEALNNFYKNEEKNESEELRNQIENLKNKLADQQVPQPVTVDDQLRLMEKSYEMAAKYMPNSTTAGKTDLSDTNPHTEDETPKAGKKEVLKSFGPPTRNLVSALYREMTDSAFLEEYSTDRRLGFQSTVENQKKEQRPRNAVKASVLETKTLAGEGSVRVRLLEPAEIQKRKLAVGTVLTATGKLQGSRLQLSVTSIEIEGSIIPVDIQVYDLEGQSGLNVPNSLEGEALGEIAGGMTQSGSAGANIMLNSSAGQQIAGDLGRGLIQGVAGYVSKKAKQVKITIKAGQQLFLVSK